MCVHNDEDCPMRIGRTCRAMSRSKSASVQPADRVYKRTRLDAGERLEAMQEFN